jgi:hypothetical protein
MASKKKHAKKTARKKVTPHKRGPSRSKTPAKRTHRGIQSSRKQSRKPVVRPVVRVRKRPARKPARIYTVTRDQKAGIKSALELVRKHIKGYEPSAGWRISELDRITPARRRTLLKKAATLRELLRQPHEIVKAKVPRDRKILFQFTRQKIRNAKHYIVHKPADNFDVRLVRGRVHVRGTFAGKVRGKRRSKVVTESAFYLFPKAVKHPDDAERMLKDMLDDMPEGFYVMLTGAHGDTGEPVDKGQLLKRLRTYINAYQFAMTGIYDRDNKLIRRVQTDQGFAQAIAGFRLLSTTVDGMQIQMQARDVRRQRQADFNERERLDRMSKKEREIYEAPRKAEAKRQQKRAAAKKGAATRKAKARKARASAVARKHK